MYKLLLALTVMSPYFACADHIPTLHRKSKNGLSLSCPDHWFSLPHLGKLNALMVFVDFENLKGRENRRTPESIAKSLLGIENGKMGIVEFYDQQSNGRLSFKVDVDYEWMRLKRRKSSTYPHPIRPVQYIRDALLLAEEDGYSMDRYDIVYVVAPKGMRHNSPTHYLRKEELSGVAHPPQVVVTFGDDGQHSRIQHVVHETGHGMGLPDLYLFDARKGDGLAVPGPWDIMGNNWKAKYFCAWNRHLWKWLDDERKVYQKTGSREINLVPVDARHGVAMVVVPTMRFPDEVIVVENPKPWNTSVKNGVMIYRANGSIDSGSGPMVLELPDGVISVESPHALWQPGQTYESNADGIRVEVLGVQEGAYQLRVTARRAKETEAAD